MLSCRNWFYLFCITLSMSIGVAFGQDQVYMKSAPNFPINVYIQEIGLNQIKYKISNKDSLAMVFTELKSNVYKIVFQNGYEFIINEINNRTEPKKAHKLTMIKTEFLSQLFGTSSISYEKLVQPKKSMELTLGLIGFGYGKNNRDGFYLKAAYKQYFGKKLRSAISHPMDGLYYKPEIVFSLYNQVFEKFKVVSAQQLSWREQLVSFRNTKQVDEYVTYGLLASIGKSAVIRNLFVFDGYFGLGFGVSSKRNISISEDFFEQTIQSSSYYNNLNGEVGDEGGLAFGSGVLGNTNNGISVLFQLGLKVGFLIK